MWSVILQNTTLSSRDKHVSFFASASQRKNDCKYNFRVFRAVFSGLSNLVLIKELVIYIIFFFFKLWKFEGFTKEERIIQLLELSCHKTAQFYLFLYICEWKQILLKKVKSMRINYYRFIVSLSLLKQLYFTIFVCLLLILWILNSCSIFVTMCTFAQFWGTFNKEKYRINSFAQNIWITNFQCNEFIETRYTAVLFKVPGVNKILTHQFFSVWL